MSVIVTIQFEADPEKFERYAAENKEHMHGIAEQAKEAGIIAHRAYGAPDGRALVVVDEWPDAESFQRFFESAQPLFQPLMEAAGVEKEPDVNLWRKLETYDDVGWGA
jgi:quinol monooxygenase YgiN